MRHLMATALLLLLSMTAACGSQSEDEAYADQDALSGPHALVFSGWADNEPVPHLYAADGTDWTVRRLPVAFDDIPRPVWSPTFDHIADESGTVLRADGSGRRDLGAYLRPGYPWSSDGSRLVYSDDAYEERPILVASVDGSSPQQLARGSTPTWAPDGSVYFSLSGSIHAVDPTSGQARVVAIAPGWVLGYEEWSPDGLHVTYDVGMEDDRSLFALDLAARDEPRALLADLDPPITDVKAYAWAPDSEHLAVVAGRDDPSAEPLGPGTYGIRWELHIVDVEDNSSRKVMDVEANDLAWSPDGEWIALRRYWGYDAARDAASDIWLVRPDGTGFQQVTNGRVPGTDWDHTRGTNYGRANWVPESVLAKMRASG